MSTVATANNRDCRCFNVIFFLDERNNEGSEFTLVPVATIRIVACHRPCAIAMNRRHGGCRLGYL